MGVRLAIRLERLILGIEHLDPGMGHGAAGVDAEQLIGHSAGRTVTAADIGGSGPRMAPSAPWARREPNSSTVRPSAARTTRLALVAMRLWWLMASSRNVSISCAWMAGARTVSSGSLGNTGVPSGTA